VNLQELLSACDVAEASGLKYVPLTTPEKFKPPRGFPRGELLCVTAGRRVNRYNCAKLRAWVERVV